MRAFADAWWSHPAFRNDTPALLPPLVVPIRPPFLAPSARRRKLERRSDAERHCGGFSSFLFFLFSLTPPVYMERSHGIECSRKIAALICSELLQAKPCYSYDWNTSPVSVPGKKNKEKKGMVLGRVLSEFRAAVGVRARRESQPGIGDCHCVNQAKGIAVNICDD
ncbi:hypothetical protein LX36DRAFT_99891 [Colletotrichum falcatum]|nr:hypothetical protein LX36DRAFT_99891 [Colletotrichum falcatum]